MGAWLSNISLKYKFWAVNAVAFITTLLLVLYAVQLEQQARSDASRASAQAQARLLGAWPANSPLPKDEHWLTFARGQIPPLADQDLSALSTASGWVELNHMPVFGENPLIGADVVTRADEQQIAVLAYGRSLSQVFGERFANYAVAVLILMLAMLGASQLLIRFLLSQLNTLKDVMLHVENTGDLSARVPLACKDEVGQMASAFNAMQAGYQRVVTTVARTAQQLDDGAARLASSMNEVQHGMLGQQSETDQAATAINEMTATVYHIAQHAGATRDLSQTADTLAGSGQEVVTRVQRSIAGLSTGVQQTAEMIQKLAEDSQKINGVVGVIHSIAEQTNLLALNAAIQASMAGDAGRGFAVVADEVQRLAERSSAATRQIETLVRAIQADTNEAVISMEQTTTEVVRGARLAQDAGVALEEIEGVSKTLAALIQSISNAAQQQTSSAGQISLTMNVIQQITTQTSSGSTATAESIGNLAKMASQLRRSVSGFTLPPPKQTED